MQFVVDTARLVVGAGEHRTIARADIAPAAIRGEPMSPREEPSDVGGRVPGDESRTLGQLQLPLASWCIEEPQASSLGGRRPSGSGIDVAGNHGLELDVLAGEGVGPGLEESVHRLDKRGVGSKVPIERRNARDFVSGLEVGVDIGAAELVDGLLGVTDEEHGHASAQQELAERAPLNGVGVLELVDERGFVLVLQRVARSVVVGLQRGADLPQQVVVAGLQAPSSLLGSALRHEGQEVTLDAYLPEVDRIVDGLVGLHEFFDGSKQRQIDRGELLVFLVGLVEHTRREEQPQGTSRLMQGGPNHWWRGQCRGSFVDVALPQVLVVRLHVGQPGLQHSSIGLPRSSDRRQRRPPAMQVRAGTCRRLDSHLRVPIPTLRKVDEQLDINGGLVSEMPVELGLHVKDGGRPEVADELLEKPCGVGAGGDVEVHAAFEPVPVEDLLTEPVDGGDGRFVILRQGAFESGWGFGDRGQMVGHWILTTRSGPQEIQRRAQTRANTVAKLGGGGAGERDCEDLVDAEVSLGHQSHEQR